VTPAARIAAAIDLLAEVEAAPRRPADAVANDFFRARRFIGAGDRRAVSDRTWGVLRARRRLGWWLSREGGEPTPRTLVAAALLFDGWSPPGLGQAFSGGKFATEVLSRDEQKVLGGLVGHTLEHPAMPAAVRLEVPDWVLPRLAARFGASLDAEMTAMLEPAPLDLRANLLKATRADARAALAAEGFDATPTRLSPWGLRLPGRRPVTAGAAFQSGLVEIQDEGSQLVALLTDARPGMRVADLCAGAGGKTLALAATMQNRGHIAACDVSAPRLDAAVRRFRRAGAHNIERHLLGAGDRWLKRHGGSFDRVLVDAPCTGTGTWRRNPDARSRLTETDLAELQVRQAESLETAAPLVRKGGRLVYATCSLFPEENEAQVKAFLDRHQTFRMLPLAQAWPHAAAPKVASPPPLEGGGRGEGSSAPNLQCEPDTPCPQPRTPSYADGDSATPNRSLPCAGDTLTLTPRQHGTDGFFAAVLERSA
jgi:16S rRNA (cytosine967-C5)-methyltransferase